MNVVIYSKDQCPYCDMAKNLFKNAGVEFKENRIGHDGFTKEMLLEAVPGARTVPQIFVDGELIGGWDQLKQHAVYKRLTSTRSDSIARND